MPQVLNISKKYLNQLKNGVGYTDNLADFTNNYTGVIMEGVQCVLDVEIEWFANSDGVDEWNIDGVNNTITRTIGSFVNDGFNIGQKFRFISGWSTDNSSPNEFEATIDFIRQDGLRLDFTVTAGAVTSTGIQPNVGIRALGNAPENYLTGLVYRFGFVENSSGPSFTSLVTSNNMGYRVGSIPRSATVNPMTPVGNILDWVTGTSSVEFVSESDYLQSYQIKHSFVVQPWFRDGERIDTQNNIPPNEFEGTNSLKHVFDLDFRQVLSDPNTAIQSAVVDSIGSVGWFDENFNGLGKDYNIVSIAYEDTLSTDAVDSIQASLRTTVTIEVEKEGGPIPAGQKAGLFISLLAPQIQYQDKTTTLLDNFLYDSAYHVEGAGTTIGTNIVQSLTSSIVSGNLVIVAELEYSASQKTTLSTINQPYYVLGLNIADMSLSNALSDRITLKADIQPYVLSSDVSGLIAFDKLDFHFADSIIGVDTGYTNFEGWNNDSLAIEFNFTLERDVLKDAVLNTISFDLVAFEDSTGNSFDLDSTSIDLSTVIISAGIQQIDIDNSRVYLFEDGNQYKKVEINTGALAGTLQNYSGVFAQKIRWEDWLRNLQANTIFFNSIAPNNGLNFKSSNYSGLNGYSVRMVVRANVQGIDDLGISKATDYEIVSPAITVNDYNVSVGYTCVIETLRESNLSDLGGAVLVNNNTLVRATFTADSGAITGITGFWAAITLQNSNDSGQQISELAIDGLDSSGLLKPKDGFSFLSIDIVSGNVVCECLVDGSKSEAVNYNFSARIKATPDDECFVEFMDGECSEFMDGELAKFMDQ